MAPSTDTTYGELRTSIQHEKERRIREYRANAAKTQSMREKGIFAEAPEPLQLIAQGDSWFDYPLPFPFHTDVIAHLQNLPSMSPHVLDLAVLGEAAEDLLGVAKLHELIDNLVDPANGGFDAILFSAGGNDLAGNQFRLWLQDATGGGTNPANGLNQERVDDVLGIVQAAYADLFIARDRAAPGVPIFGHSYDFAIPSGVGVCGVGPWLKPGLDDRGWTDPSVGRQIVKLLLEQFANMLDGFEADSNKHFVHVRTQGTLSDQQWANELHPTPEGFAAIAAKFVTALRASNLFPGRI